LEKMEQQLYGSDDEVDEWSNLLGTTV
jgi:hypothetical protein